jgi:hypothetical protein
MDDDKKLENEARRRNVREMLARRLREFYSAISSELPPRIPERLERLAGKQQ